MKLTSTQITGLLAVIGFGGFLIVKLLMPHDPDRLPSGIRLSDLPAIDATTPPDTAPPPEKPLEVGSQDAREDLYCSGIVFATQLESAGGNVAENQKRIDAYAALAENGRAKLVAEKAVTESNAVVVGNAWADKARADFKANALAIPLDKCLARPAAKAKPASSSSGEPAPDLLMVGSQDARDDLYCSGLIDATRGSDPRSPVDPSGKQLTAMLALVNAGLDKLLAEGVAVTSDISPNGTAAFANAHASKAKADHDAKTPRIPLDKCMALAAALPAH